MFWLSTCVGLRYDQLLYSHNGFSRQRGVNDFSLTVVADRHHLLPYIAARVQV
jgi:hypothetical protein